MRLCRRDGRQAKFSGSPHCCSTCLCSPVLGLYCSWPGRKTGQRWEANRAPIRGPRPKRGVVFGAPFGSPSPKNPFGIGTSAINPGGLGAGPHEMKVSLPYSSSVHSSFGGAATDIQSKRMDSGPLSQDGGCRGRSHSEEPHPPVRSSPDVPVRRPGLSVPLHKT
jgi:hypothetical protein